MKIVIFCNVCFLYAGMLFAGRLAGNSEAWSYMEAFITRRSFPGFEDSHDFSI